VADFVDEIIEYEEWSFPTIEIPAPAVPELVELTEIVMIPELTTDDKQDQISNIEALEVETLLLDEASVLSDAVVDKESLLDERMKYLDSICAEMSQQFADFEKSLFTNMVKVVQKSVRKIIGKELTLDQNIFKNMLEDALNKLNVKEHPCVIFVSADDLNFTEQNIFLSNVQFKVDHNLQKGDFIIENKFVTLEALLEERINTLFSTMSDT
jgi:Flagellar assembly protein FliH